MYKRCTHGGTADELCDICETQPVLYHIKKQEYTWTLHRSDNDQIVDVRNTRDDIVDAWARAAKLPVCSICRCVHGQEIVHECE